MKLSKQKKKKKIQCIFPTLVKDKTFPSFPTNKILVEDAPQIHHQGVKQIIAQKVVLF